MLATLTTTIALNALLNTQHTHTRTPLMVAEKLQQIADPKITGPLFNKKLSTPDPIPKVGRERAQELMESGALFRYTPGFVSETARAEADITEYTGFKYAVGFNSCGSALFIALKTAGVQPGDEVLANAFSFTAVPSSIHHAGGIPIYVESLDSYVVDPVDLEKKITPGKTKFLMLTHMRGKVADMDAIYAICDKHGVTVVEDCAHALGVQWDGVQLGRSALAACYSTQSAKVINSGEGGFLCTDDPEVAARAFCYAGCYEQLYDQHVVSPPADVFDAVKHETPNYSLRMNDLAAACVRPQIADIEYRIEEYNRRYERIVNALAPAAEHFHIPDHLAKVRPVLDSLQINLVGVPVAEFLAATKRRGLPVGLFGAADNARNHKCWKYAPTTVPLPRTDALISAAIDIRLPAVFADEDLDQMAKVLLAALDDVMNAPAA